MTNVPMPIMPVPARVLALEARFASGRAGTLGGGVDADVFGARLDEATRASSVDMSPRSGTSTAKRSK